MELEPPSIKDPGNPNSGARMVKGTNQGRARSNPMVPPNEEEKRGLHWHGTC
jgi:hypothetical protein